MTKSLRVYIFKQDSTNYDLPVITFDNVLSYSVNQETRSVMVKHQSEWRPKLTTDYFLLTEGMLLTVGEE